MFAKFGFYSAFFRLRARLASAGNQPTFRCRIDSPDPMSERFSSFASSDRVPPRRLCSAMIDSQPFVGCNPPPLGIVPKAYSAELTSSQLDIGPAQAVLTMGFQAGYDEESRRLNRRKLSTSYSMQRRLLWDDPRHYPYRYRIAKMTSQRKSVPPLEVCCISWPVCASAPKIHPVKGYQVGAVMVFHPSW
jgi:hypothetical protein